jgi:hypothetical protein
MASTSILRAVVSFTFRGPRGPVAVRKGSTYHKDSPRLQGISAEALEANFAPFSPDFGPDSDSGIEQATAAPGEKRGGPKRAKKDGSAETAQAKVEQATAAPGEKRDSESTGTAEKPKEASAGTKE